MTILGGRLTAGAGDGRWTVTVTIPIAPVRSEPAGTDTGLERAGV